MHIPIGITHFGAPQASSKKLSLTKQLLPGKKTPWNQANIFFLPTQQGLLLLKKSIEEKK